MATATGWPVFVWIEGNTLTLNETKAVLEHGVTIGGKSLREHLEAINHREAIGLLEALAGVDDPLNERSVKELHALILRSIDQENAGRWKRRNVIISGSDFTPPDFLHVPEYMERFLNWCLVGGTTLHPVERAAGYMPILSVYIPLSMAMDGPPDY